MDSFDDLNLKDELLQGIHSSGFETLSDIQKRSITSCIDGRNTIVQAQSGTDKTATFSIAALQRMNTESTNCQILIVVPTEDLAKQTSKVFNNLGDYMKVQSYVCVESTALEVDLETLQKGVQAVVGTPGRVDDMINRNALGTDELKMFVLDEADEIFSNGSTVAIHGIMKRMPWEAQLCLFSATLPDEVNTFSERYIPNPVKILLDEEVRTLDKVQQYFVLVEEENWKFDLLCDMNETLTVSQVMIYCNTNESTKLLTEKLTGKGYNVSCMHGEMEMSERELVMKMFRRGSPRILVATADLAIGIDVQWVKLFMNYDLPTKENYIYMIGRTGQFATKCIAINFTNDIRKLFDLKQFYQTNIDEMPKDIEEVIFEARL